MAAKQHALFEATELKERVCLVFRSSCRSVCSAKCFVARLYRLGQWFAKRAGAPLYRLVQSFACGVSKPRPQRMGGRAVVMRRRGGGMEAMGQERAVLAILGMAREAAVWAMEGIFAGAA